MSATANLTSRERPDRAKCRTSNSAVSGSGGAPTAVIYAPAPTIWSQRRAGPSSTALYRCGDPYVIVIEAAAEDGVRTAGRVQWTSPPSKRLSRPPGMPISSLTG